MQKRTHPYSARVAQADGFKKTRGKAAASNQIQVLFLLAEPLPLPFPMAGQRISVTRRAPALQPEHVQPGHLKTATAPASRAQRDFQARRARPLVMLVKRANTQTNPERSAMIAQLAGSKIKT
jgi:hypothetical protein